ncbi:MAG TPA: hypothetical protein VMS78_12645 [Rhizomicrobium sp.]|nr:hypothetical protein [Rhizomicrobium sp.]
MKNIPAAFAFACAALIATDVFAVDFSFDGYGDLRLVAPSSEVSYLDGGLGKLRYGGSDDSPGVHVSELALQARAQITGELSSVVVLRSDPEHGPAVDILEGYVRYRPVSTNNWRWSAKVGAFFPAISLENTEIGWTSYWTLTPSAINSWIGDELRTIGGEGKAEWRDDASTFSVTGAVFGFNDPAGVMIAHRGWTMNDRPTGLLEHSREADAVAISFGEPIPYQAQLFAEIDHRVGWYAQASWEENGIGRIDVTRYDNRGKDDAEMGEQYAWETTFWSGGLRTGYDDFTLLMQGMSGYTAVEPFEDFEIETTFKAAYALIGWQRDNWRLAARADVFQTRTETPFGPSATSEDGHAFTLAATWVPQEWLRLTAEFLSVNSTRAQRSIVGLSPDQTDNQFQLAARFYL